MLVSLLMYAQPDCSQCPFIYHLDDNPYCSETTQQCGQQFSLTFQNCPEPAGSGEFCDFCNPGEAFLQFIGGNPNISVVSIVDNGSSTTYTFVTQCLTTGPDCYTICLSYWPCGIECEFIGFCYENSRAYHYVINVCGNGGPPTGGDGCEHRVSESTCLNFEAPCDKECPDPTCYCINAKDENGLNYFDIITVYDERTICYPDALEGYSITEVDCVKKCSSGLPKADAMTVYDIPVVDFDEKEVPLSFTAYPNPTVNEQLTLDITNASSEIVDLDIELYGVNSQLHKQVQVKLEGGLNQQTLDLPDGIRQFVILAKVDGKIVFVKQILSH